MTKCEKALLLAKLEGLRVYLIDAQQFDWAMAVRDAKWAIGGKKKAKAKS